MNIAFIGQKGIPAHFGGVEFHVDELTRRLVRRGHRVSAYVRSWYTPRDHVSYQGVQLLHTPTIRTKHLDALLHSLTSSVHALARDFDIVHYHALGPSFFAWLPRCRGRKIVVTIHALDWQRPKWGPAARASLKMAERTAVRLAHGTIVVSRPLQEYVERKYGCPVRYVPNGVDVGPTLPPTTITEKWGLKGEDYVLFLGRLVPEKGVEWLIRTYCGTSSPLPLIIAGDDDGMKGYARQLRALTGDPRVLFTGTVTGRVKEELLGNASLFIAPSSLEGLPIALLEAMAHGRCCLVSDIPPHRELIEPGRDGVCFTLNDSDEFTRALQELLAETAGVRRALGQSARRKVGEHYSWERVVDETESIYQSLLDDHRRE